MAFEDETSETQENLIKAHFYHMKYYDNNRNQKQTTENLTDEEMKDFTLCKQMMIGDLIPWNINDWTFTDGISNDEYLIESVEYKSLCPNIQV